jgi:hypothetical protein
MPHTEPITYYAWNDPQPVPVAPAASLPLPVPPYSDELYLPPTIRPGDGGAGSADSEGTAQLRVWMAPAEAQLH